MKPGTRTNSSPISPDSHAPPPESVRSECRRSRPPALLQRPRPDVFFFDYEGTRIRQAANSSLNDEPPLSFRDGNFSSSSTLIYDPATRVLGAGGVVTATPFPGNIIPGNRMDPAALKYQSLTPLPNAGSPNATSRNYLGTSPTTWRATRATCASISASRPRTTSWRVSLLPGRPRRPRASISSARHSRR